MTYCHSFNTSPHTWTKNFLFHLYPVFCQSLSRQFHSLYLYACILHVVYTHLVICFCYQKLSVHLNFSLRAIHFLCEYLFIIYSISILLTPSLNTGKCHSLFSFTLIFGTNLPNLFSAFTKQDCNVKEAYRFLQATGTSWHYLPNPFLTPTPRVFMPNYCFDIPIMRRVFALNFCRSNLAAHSFELL